MQHSQPDGPPTGSESSVSGDRARGTAVAIKSAHAASGSGLSSSRTRHAARKADVAKTRSPALTGAARRSFSHRLLSEFQTRRKGNHPCTHGRRMYRFQTLVTSYTYRSESSLRYCTVLRAYRVRMYAQPQWRQYRSGCYSSADRPHRSQRARTDAEVFARALGSGTVDRGRTDETSIWRTSSCSSQTRS